MEAATDPTPIKSLVLHIRRQAVMYGWKQALYIYIYIMEGGKVLILDCCMIIFSAGFDKF